MEKPKVDRGNASFIQISDVDECKATKSPCINAVSCLNLPGSYTCKCREGWTADIVTTILMTASDNASTGPPALTWLTTSIVPASPDSQVSEYSNLCPPEKCHSRLRELSRHENPFHTSQNLFQKEFKFSFLGC